MQRERISPNNLSEFLRYLVSPERAVNDRLPALTELSREVGVSVPSLREQMEVARTLGLVEVRPRTGIRRLPYTFGPAVLHSLSYAVAEDPARFDAYADLRNHVESVYWYEAVEQLTPAETDQLQGLVEKARNKLTGYPVQIPHAEHRALHMLIYSRLNNPFVTGILSTYWDVYESIGLAVYADLSYLTLVWNYHAKMVDAICCRDFAAGYQALTEHVHLISQREPAAKLV
jgi:DNA-binding FadR family transcriptional regulator